FKPPISSWSSNAGGTARSTAHPTNCARKLSRILAASKRSSIAISSSLLASSLPAPPRPLPQFSVSWSLPAAERLPSPSPNSLEIFPPKLANPSISRGSSKNFAKPGFSPPFLLLKAALPANNATNLLTTLSPGPLSNGAGIFATRRNLPKPTKEKKQQSSALNRNKGSPKSASTKPSGFANGPLVSL